MLARLWGWVRGLFRGVEAPRPDAPRAAALMHHVPEGARTPRCGKATFRRWTIILEDATCPECQELGARARVDRLLSVR